MDVKLETGEVRITSDASVKFPKDLQEEAQHSANTFIKAPTDVLKYNNSLSTSTPSNL